MLVPCFGSEYWLGPVKTQEIKKNAPRGRVRGAVMRSLVFIWNWGLPRSGAVFIN